MYTVLLLILLLLLLIYILYINFEKQYAGNFPKLFQSPYKNTNNIAHQRIYINSFILQKGQQTKITQEKTVSTISKEVVEKILNELDIFENNGEYLTKGITLGNLARKINTNTAYLSEVINIYKGKNFTSYLNDLRVDYAIHRFSEDKKFRSYKLTVIAEELGYNNEQAFSTAFKKRTGNSLSIYLKEIN
ncbi:helix-turn-helix domain-containing protein [Chryseobacterium oryctis]|uniref:AraC family transcriptional regulator n=1 Tax=Chryseobacterium oryctis TaxID=2952618 RepID=A0ABT3HIV9_9FLAO|nr:AraC family transcriptional regulator [Chryseobacterium oryctis]MCW3159723.1 AraC family transcriptional regulator [Chryseobacterium oryctis]